MVLRGKSIYLRPLQRTDLPARLHMVNDPAVKLQMTGIVGDDTSEQSIYNWFQMYSTDPHSEQWAIVDGDDQYLGDIDLHSIGVLDNEAWMSPMFGAEKIRENKELRKEALYLITAYAFETKGVAKVQIDIPDVDTVGIEALEELGFVLVETFEMDFITGAQLLTYAVTPAKLRETADAADFVG